MEQLYQDYKDIAEFFMVYITEAHAIDDARPVAYAKELGIREHTSFRERCSVASRLLLDKKLTIPCLADNMDNATRDAYEAGPDRIFLVRKDGTVGVAARRGPWGFPSGLRRATKWLAQFKETGREPELAAFEDTQDSGPDYRELIADMMGAYSRGNYQDALDIAEKAYALRPESVDLLYNTACLHCLNGNKKEAYNWIERAMAAGYDDAEHLQADPDFEPIRGEERFRELVRRAGEQKPRADKAGSQRSNPAAISGH